MAEKQKNSGKDAEGQGAKRAKRSAGKAGKGKDTAGDAAPPSDSERMTKPRKKGRPVEMMDGWARTTLIVNYDLLTDTDIMTSTWTKTSRAMLKRSEVMRACMAAIVAAWREGDLAEAAACTSEAELTALLTKRLRGR